jgi:hypothetical protein
MSSSKLNELIKQKLLKDVDRAARNTIGKASRKALSTTSASQCLVLDRRAVTALTLGMEEGIGRKLTSYERKKYRSSVKTFFIGMSKPYPNVPGRKYFLDILRRNKLELGRNIFFLGTDFDGIKAKYHKHNKKFIKDTKSLNGTDYDVKKPGSPGGNGVQFDHGAEGTAIGTLGGGASAVSVALDKGVDFEHLKSVASENLEAILATQFHELSSSARSKMHKRLFDIIINQDQVVKPGTGGGIVGGVGIIIRPIKTKDNASRSTLEKQEQAALIEAVSKTIETTDWFAQEGSSSLRNKAKAAAILSVTDPLTKLSKKSKGKLSLKLDPKITQTALKTNSKGSKRTKKDSGVSPTAYTTKKGRLATGAIASKVGKRAKQSNFNTVSMIGILNSKLSDTVAKNMGSPKLNYRTGRFAGSVRVTDITITAKGHPSIGYTYQRDPYEVFESSSGSKFSSMERDPRKLIDVSIRELAAQQAIGRLFTRRV